MTFSYISEKQNKERLDSYVAEQLTDMSRSRIQSLIKSGDVTVNGVKTKAGYTLASGDTIDVNIPEPEVTDISAEVSLQGLAKRNKRRDAPRHSSQNR